MTPLEYVRRRRITESVRDLADTDEYISQIGYKHGFNSKENFTRAFQTEHHICPSEYRMTDNSLKLLHRIRPDEDTLILVPKIVSLEPFSATVYKSDEEDPTRFWNKYNCGGFPGDYPAGRHRRTMAFPCGILSRASLTITQGS